MLELLLYLIFLLLEIKKCVVYGNVMFLFCNFLINFNKIVIFILLFKWWDFMYLFFVIWICGLNEMKFFILIFNLCILLVENMCLLIWILIFFLLCFVLFVFLYICIDVWCIKIVFVYVLLFDVLIL